MLRAWLPTESSYTASGRISRGIDDRRHDMKSRGWAWLGDVGLWEHTLGAVIFPCPLSVSRTVCFLVTMMCAEWLCHVFFTMTYETSKTVSYSKSSPKIFRHLVTAVRNTPQWSSKSFTANGLQRPCSYLLTIL